MILLLTILFGLARGLYEGMVMFPGGVREHVAFWTYHVLGLAIFIACIRLVYLIYIKKIHWMYLAGLLLILWECTEVGYMIARTDISNMTYEHIAFLDIISYTITGLPLWILHIVRTLVGTHLVIAVKDNGGEKIDG